MFGQYRVVCTTPAGRRRYLRVLAPQILASPLVDEYHLWINTTDLADLAYLRELQATDSRVRVIPPASLPPGKTTSIRQFYRGCIDEDAIYVRFDDDVVFIEPEFFEKFLTFRVAHPRFFLVFPNTINNALCTYALVERGIVKPGACVQPWCMDVTAWANPRFAEQLHRAFLSAVNAGEVPRWYFGRRLVAHSRYSVNCMSWFGREFAAFGGEVPREEEEYLTVTKPTELMAVNCIYGDAVVAHYAFMPQRPYLDSTDVLERYAALGGRARAHAASGATDRTPIDLWAPRLFETVERIRTAALDDLRSALWVADWIRHAGLLFDRRFVYGDDNRCMNTEHVGLAHVPMQLARCLVALGEYAFTRVVDTKTGNGWRTAILAAYLSRFNAALEVVALDPGDASDGLEAIAATLPISYKTPHDARRSCGPVVRSRGVRHPPVVRTMPRGLSCRPRHRHVLPVRRHQRSLRGSPRRVRRWCAEIVAGTEGRISPRLLDRVPRSLHG